jgi:hypothetical protein
VQITNLHTVSHLSTPVAEETEQKLKYPVHDIFRIFFAKAFDIYLSLNDFFFI